VTNYVFVNKTTQRRRGARHNKRKVSPSSEGGVLTKEFTHDRFSEPISGKEGGVKKKKLLREVRQIHKLRGIIR